MSLSYDPLLESKHCVKMHVVPVNFIVAFHESCHQSKLKSFFTTTVEECRHPVEQKLQN